MTTPKQWQSYIETLRQRDRAEKEQVQRRYEHAWQLARQAAEVLRRDFGATRAVVFGSLLHPDSFGKYSDVDIAAWGVQPEDTLRAMNAVAKLDEQIVVNLVDVHACKPGIRRVIESEGVDV